MAASRTAPVVLPVDVIGLGAALPDRVVTNDDLSEVLDTNDEWIRTRTGIRQRHMASPHETTGTLGLAAARGALADAGVDPADIGAVVLATSRSRAPVSSRRSASQRRS